MDETWRDSKKPWWLLALIVPLLPFGSLAAWTATGSGWSWWLTPVLVFGFIPLLDGLVGNDAENPPEAMAEWLQQARFYRWITYAFVPVQYASTILGAVVWARGELAPLATVGLVVSVGIVNGIAINTAHELGHKREQLERWLSKVALAPTAYGHFYVEHNRGHHVRVATPQDPASSRRGESFWAFFPRTVFGSLTSAWRLERNRLKLRGKRVFSPRNEVLNAWAMTLALYTALTVVCGPSVLVLLAGQAVIGFGLLEAVNYLEHYGLQRTLQPNGRYEKVDARHSWNSDRLITNLFLFQLQRHSDHHANPLRRYQALRSFECSPQLPYGYATMILIALVPALWRTIMDPLLEEHRLLQRAT